MAPSWTQHYDAGVPESLAPYPLKTLIDYARENATLRPDAPAVFFKGTRLSNADLVRLSDRFASASSTQAFGEVIASRCCCPTAHNL